MCIGAAFVKLLSDVTGIQTVTVESNLVGV